MLSTMRETSVQIKLLNSKPTKYGGKDFEDGERRLAYLYLSEKGYVDLFIDENGANANIRAAGIELVEGGRITVH